MFKWFTDWFYCPPNPPPVVRQEVPGGRNYTTGPSYSPAELAMMEQIAAHCISTGKVVLGKVDEDGNLKIKDIDTPARHQE